MFSITFSSGCIQGEYKKELGNNNTIGVKCTFITLADTIYNYFNRYVAHLWRI